MSRWFASLALFLFVTAAAAQQLPPLRPPELINPGRGSNIGLGEFFGTRTPYEFWLTCIIIAFGFGVILLLLWHFRSMPEHRPEDVARAVVIVTVIVGTLILVTAGYSNDQIAPAFGLFGTIIGYILGRLTPLGAHGESSQAHPHNPERGAKKSGDPAGSPEQGTATLQFSSWDGATAWNTFQLAPRQTVTISCARCGDQISIAFHDGTANRTVNAKAADRYGLYWDQSQSRWDFASIAAIMRSQGVFR
jgi:hypothetical protein